MNKRSIPLDLFGEPENSVSPIIGYWVREADVLLSDCYCPGICFLWIEFRENMS